MKFETRRVFSNTHLAVGLAVLTLAAPASAQATDDQTPAATQVAEGTSGQQGPAAIPPARPAGLSTPSWSANAGFEGDSHDTGYASFGPQYVKPFAPNVAWVAGGNVNYLFYQYPNGAGETHVRAPGVAAKGGVKFGGKNYLQLTAGPSFKRRYIETRDVSNGLIAKSSDNVFGVNFGADAWVEPTSHSTVYGIFDYSGSDGYKWSRLAYREQVSNHNWGGKFAHFVGAEVIGQGNKDITSTQIGAFFEVVHVPSSVSIMFRGGYKRSTFEAGPDLTGPWFAIGFWHRM